MTVAMPRAMIGRPAHREKTTGNSTPILANDMLVIARYVLGALFCLSETLRHTPQKHSPYLHVGTSHIRSTHRICTLRGNAQGNATVTPRICHSWSVIASSCTRDPAPSRGTESGGRHLLLPRNTDPLSSETRPICARLYATPVSAHRIADFVTKRNIDNLLNNSKQVEAHANLSLYSRICWRRKHAANTLSARSTPPPTFKYLTDRCRNWTVGFDYSVHQFPLTFKHSKLCTTARFPVLVSTYKRESLLQFCTNPPVSIKGRALFK